MKQKLDIEEIKQKIFNKLEPSGWGQKLKPFIFSGDFDNIITQLARLSTDGKRYTPPLKQMFRAFEECPLDKLKIIIVGQDPYPQLGVADGISLSCAGNIQPSLEYVLDEINRSVYNFFPVSNDPDLTRWSNQGVLLLNTALTTTVGKIGQHYSIWKPFIAYLFDYLTWNHTGLIYIYLGKPANEWIECVNDNNYKFVLTHPSSVAYSKHGEWSSEGVFLEAKNIIQKNTNEIIVW